MSRELEFKLAADGPVTTDLVQRAARTAGIRLGPLRKVRQADTYLDDAGLRLARAGVGLRIRVAKKLRVLTWKSAGSRSAGLFSRDEIELPWSGAAPDRARSLPTDVRDRTEPFVYHHRLIPSVRLRTDRTFADAHAADSGVARICIDRVQVRHGKNGKVRGTFHEIEIEVLDGPVEPWQDLTQALRASMALRDSRRDKLQRALALVRGELPGSQKTRVTAKLPPGEAARRVLRRHLLQLQREEARVRTGRATEPVHKLRVACRKMRAALQTFGDFLPPKPTRRFRRLLRSTARSFAVVRDIDVLLVELEKCHDELPERLRDSAEHLLDELRVRRRRKHRKGRRALRAKARVRAFEELQEFVESAAPADDGREREASTIASSMIGAAASEVFEQGGKLGSGAEREVYHELRIRMKRLRYTAESFRDVFGEQLDRFIERTTKLQDLLGAFHDACVAQDILVATAKRGRRNGTLRGHDPLAIGAMIVLQEQRARALRQELAPAWSAFVSDDARASLEAILRLVPSK